MPKITIYTTPTCPYCHAAKELLAHKHLAYHEIDVSADPTLRTQMIERAHGRRTVPQIFVGRTYVGGSQDLHELEAKGYLDAIIEEEAATLSNGAA